MVAKITTGKSIRGILNYNENKVKEGAAECILASRFILNESELTSRLKQEWFKLWTSQRENVKTNAVHISLNFDSSENISTEKLKEIATLYMDKIGFGDQPFLVYRHFDAAHPHVHLITTNITDEGKRIDLHNIGRYQSEKARKEIEIEFSLVKAEGRKESQGKIISPINIEKAVYGKTQTKQAISNVVREVSKNYRYTSLAEMNAVLRLFNVIADRGFEGTKMFEKKGLVYSLLNVDGKKVGVPIKSSSVYEKPTLTFLESQFQENEKLRRPQQIHLKNLIDKSLEQNKHFDKDAFIKSLHDKGVSVLFRTNKEGVTYGVTFVDHLSKVVFNGSDIGKNYGAKAIMEKLSKGINTRDFKLDNSFTLSQPIPYHFKNDIKEQNDKSSIDLILGVLVKPNPDYTISSPSANRRKRKRRKRKRI